MALSFIQPITLSPSLLQRMASNDDGKCKMEEEVESSMARKWLQLSDDDGGDDDSFDSQKEEPEEEETEEEVVVSSEEMSMNQLDTSEKLYARCAYDILFTNDGDTPSTSSEPRTPESHQCSDKESSNDDDDDDDTFWM
jgi:hypothetical protein